MTRDRLPQPIGKQPNLPGVRVLNAEISEREMTIQIETTDDQR
jgi:hypothetical protein